MAGTTIKDLNLTKVVDGDTVKVEIDGKEESLRLCCLDTEESRAGGSKPVTKAGKLASKWAKEYFGVNEDGFPTDPVTVDIEFDTSDPVQVCLRKHRGNYDRLLCYVHNGGENYNISVVKEGWSPYFVKYGRSRLYHSEFLAAEADAQSKGVAIWNLETNAGGKKRDYDQLISWWHLRDSVVQDYRKLGIQSGAKSVRLDYDEILEAAGEENDITVFCDLQSGINKWTNNGALVYAGSPHHKFNLWIPDTESTATAGILNLVEKRYAGYGRGYVYVSGQASLWPPNDGGKPQIVLTDVAQLSDLPPGM
ncbi:MAG: thermonuclease family protein [Desulfobacteraceae bacterium]|jgi:micrococcal nuclease|nr:thermonuclease family protein [Desulfobacteraceae bacterium]